MIIFFIKYVGKSLGFDYICENKIFLFFKWKFIWISLLLFLNLREKLDIFNIRFVFYNVSLQSNIS